jgi:hypothetical protein
MKKMILFASLALFGGLLYSCSKDEANTTAQFEQKNLKTAVNCEECVASYEGSLETYTGFVKTTGNKSIPAADLKLDVWNDDIQVHYRVYRLEGGTFGNIKINNGNTIGFDPAVTEYSWTDVLPTDWAKCDEYSVALVVSGVSGGGKYTGTYTYSLRELCEVGCEETFSYEGSGNTYTFTYTPAEDMTDVPVVFTFAQGTYVSGLDGFTESGVTMQKTMSFTGCIPVSWTVILTPNCPGNGNSGNSNVWTDFKVGGFSKKNNDTPNIAMSCN